MIEVQMRRGVAGCIWYPLGCLTLGLVPLIARWGQRGFARRMNEQGIETRGGKWVPWAQITGIRRAQTRVGGPSVYGGGGRTAYYGYVLTSPQGNVEIPLSHAANEEEVRAFTLAHLPQHLLGGTGGAPGGQTGT
jgi:hypothetical protein